MSSHPSNVPPAAPIAVIGCGAIAESFYLPALAKLPHEAESLVLVDTSQHRAAALAAKFGIKKTVTDYHEILGHVRGVIVAVPHHLHYAISTDFLTHGAHVLCEKPLAEKPDEVRALIALAAKNNTTISVNNTRRLYPASIAVRDRIRLGEIGSVKSIVYLDGSEFDWPTASGFYFDSRISKKGILLDMGAHVVDLACWWLGEKPRLTASENDSLGGIEAVASIRLGWKGGEGEIMLSRLAKLPNTYTVVGERGTISGEAYDFNTITVTRNGKSSVVACHPPAGRDPDLAMALMQNFLAVIAGTEKPIVPAEEVLPSIEIIDEAYQRAVRYPLPWYAREGAAQ
jgi:predicted dehydrogenase